MNILGRETKTPKKGNGLYETPPGIEIENKDDEIEYERFIVNLDKPLIKRIKDFIHKEQKHEVKLWDIKTGKYKNINKSLWVREVLLEALNKADEEERLRKKREQLLLEKTERTLDVEESIREDLNKNLTEQ
jgi:hypothetical protein